MPEIVGPVRIEPESKEKPSASAADLHAAFICSSWRLAIAMLTTAITAAMTPKMIPMGGPSMGRV